MTNTVELLNELKDKTWVRLNHLVHKDIPRFSAFDPVEVSPIASVDNDGFLAQKVSIGTQYGTHLDAPFHFVNGKRTLQELTVKERFLPLVVINCEEAVEENPDFELKVEHILEFEKENGKIEEKTFVAFASGWSKRFDNPEEFINEQDGIQHAPGWSIEALKFLHEERNVLAIGHETLNTDSGLEFHRNGGLPAEYYWLSCDKYQLEVLNNLHQLPPKGAVIFISVPNIDGVSGFTCEAIAIY